MYEHILVAIDGSQPSRSAGGAAMTAARATGARITVCHVYGVDIHRRRFMDMEPGLPEKYRREDSLCELRTAHDRLMDEGFRALSAGYVEQFVQDCRDAGVNVEAAAVQGRSYAGILQLARSRGVDLIALGAVGIGTLGDGVLGGTAGRVLHAAPCDLLVARCDPGPGPILAGVDGSEQALKAVDKAAALGRAMGKPVRIAAVYDPYFHTHVFHVMAGSLSTHRQEQVGLAAQEKLHDDIINEGLGKLYRDFLEEARVRAARTTNDPTTVLLKGKAYHAINLHAEQCRADWVVVGRHGHHRQADSQLGSNTETVVRRCQANVLVVGGIENIGDVPAPATDHAETVVSTPALAWDTDAEARLQRVPSFVRAMARRAVEDAVRESGHGRVTVGDFDEMASRFGMGRPGGAS